MDKNAIKKYAVWARNELITRVTQKAEQYEITENKTTPKDAESINGHLLTDAEKNQRKALIEKIQADGFEQVMEEVAYTWFNRFTALRFMEVNNYLPSHTRVFTNEVGEFKPQILADAIQLDLEGLDMDKVFELKDANKTEELYKYLLITQCNALSAVLPRMFQKIEHYTELLLPDYLLREGSVIEQMITLIPEKDWTDQVQIIGWLYQYYNTEPKAKVFAKPKGQKITKSEVPAATQLFTPDWIVRYMVENSLGRLWLGGHPNEALKAEWKYYMDGAQQEEKVQKEIETIRKTYAGLRPEDIRCIDPCMGSGHILCYMFDVLVRIYEDYGYTAREAVGNIVSQNICGLDIDERAAQLAYFAVMMKARQYDRRFFTRGIQPNVYMIQESNNLTKECLEFFCAGSSSIKKALGSLVEELHDAKEYGSILTISDVDFDCLYARLDEIAKEPNPSIFDYQALDLLNPFIHAAQVLAQKYDIVVTNPPYMAVSAGDAKLYKYVNKNYKDAKTDMFAVFILRCKEFLKKRGFQAMITQQAWMFLSSYENLRMSMKSSSIVNMAHLGARAFEEIAGEVVQTTSFILTDYISKDYAGRYSRLLDGQSQEEKEKMFLDRASVFSAKQEDYDLIPGNPIAYWMTDRVLDVYMKGTPLGEIAAPRKGNSTSDNNRFLRLWYEVDSNKMNLHSKEIDREDSMRRRWYPYNKGGGYRKWYGFNEYLVDWYDDAAAIRSIKTAVIANYQYFMKPGLTWSTVSTTNFSIRWFDEGYIFDNGGCCIFELGEKRAYLAGLLNSSVFKYIFGQLNPTLNFQSGEVAKFPVIFEPSNHIDQLVKRCVEISKEEYDSFETSWDFKVHPLMPWVLKKDVEKTFKEGDALLSECYDEWKKKCDSRYSELKRLEEELNKCFINIYGLNDELSPEVSDKDLTLRLADKQRDIKSLISYAVGCMFGRYSIDNEGLIYAGGKWNWSQYDSFSPDKDAIIPICDDEYFEDDIVAFFIRFIETVYGKKHREENLKFIADTLGGKGTSREIIRNYFINDFYADHVKTYQKRPIYWLFDSGKKNGFKCLTYIHRYQPDLLARIRTDYVHEQQSRYRTALADLTQRINGTSATERVQLNKRISSLQDQATEIHGFEEKIHHLADQMIKIDLDSGVKVNYEIFNDVLAKIK